jgi:hypothetical protein
MKYLTLLVLLLGLAIAASAQGTVNFSNLPDVSSPTPMPNGYGGVNWAGVFYVDPWEWGGAGPGFKHAQNGPGKDVAFSPYACGGITCYASITSVDGKGFLLFSATAAAGYESKAPTPLVALAYSHGQYVGTQTFMLTTDLQQLDFPPAWGAVTQVVFQGSVVFYDMTLQILP